MTPHPAITALLDTDRLGRWCDTLGTDPVEPDAGGLLTAVHRALSDAGQDDLDTDRMLVVLEIGAELSALHGDDHDGIGRHTVRAAEAVASLGHPTGYEKTPDEAARALFRGEQPG